MEKKKVDIKGLKYLSIGKEVQKDGFYGLPVMYQCKLDDGSQYLVTSTHYAHESSPVDSSAIGAIIIAQPNGIVCKWNFTSTIVPHDTELQKFLSPDVELNGNNFKATYHDGDYEVGVAVLVPAEQHVDFTI